MSFKENLMMTVSLQNLLASKRVGPQEGLSRGCQPDRLRRLKVRKKKSGEKRVKMKVVYISLGARIQTILVPMLRAVLTELKASRKPCRIQILVTIRMFWNNQSKNNQQLLHLLIKRTRSF